MATAEDYWKDAHGSGCKWRSVRKAKTCDECSATIEVGAKYLDTGEIVEPPWRTARLCAACATRPMTEERVRI